jgi:hypothetical protein
MFEMVAATDEAYAYEPATSIEAQRLREGRSTTGTRPQPLPRPGSTIERVEAPSWQTTSIDRDVRGQRSTLVNDMRISTSPGRP